MSLLHIIKPYHAVDNFVFMISLNFANTGVKSKIYESYKFEKLIHDVPG